MEIDMDWNAAYDNSASVNDRDYYIDRWISEASSFRSAMSVANRCELDLAYGPGERNRADFFFPTAEVKGLVIYIHGGYWRMLDKTYWSHLAQGINDHGFAFAIPSYTLAPEATIPQITRDVTNAINVLAQRVAGPVYLVGHSAGGHLVSRMACDDVALDPSVVQRIRHIMPISGLYDLEPLTKTKMNEDLKIDAETVQSESAIYLNPRSGIKLTCVVGGNELSEFLRHNNMLEVWNEKGASVKTVINQGFHHFDVIDPLEEADSEMVRMLLQL